MADTATAYCKEQDPAKRKELINQWNTIWTTHNYNLGTIIGRKGLAIAKRFQNVPAGTPPHMYQWVEDVLMSEMVWTPVDQQKQQVRPDTIPEYEQLGFSPSHHRRWGSSCAHATRQAWRAHNCLTWIPSRGILPACACDPMLERGVS